MSNIPEGSHHCWSQKCEKCNTINRGCIRWNVKCYNCKELLSFSYSLNETKFLETISKNLSIYKEQSTPGFFTKDLIPNETT